MTFRWLAFASCLAALSCDVPETEVVPPAATAAKPKPRAKPYKPKHVFLVGKPRVEEIAGERTIKIAAFRPTGAPRPMPVVLVSNVGAGDPLLVMPPWTKRLTQGGFFSIAIAHDNDTHAADIKAVLAWLQTNADLEGVVDLDKIAHVGHGAAAAADASHESIVALIALAPDPNAGKLAGVKKPMLVMARKPVATQSGDKHLLTIDHEAARHSTFAGDLERCIDHQLGDKMICANFRRALRSTMIAFLDTYLRQDEKARSWLTSGEIEGVSGGVAKYQKR